MRRPIVFLHVPKTGGQTIHHAVASTFRPEERSPIRVMSQANERGPFPQEYLFHSGHLDWSRLEEVQGDPFVFMVLRAPRERLGSMYFYMRGKQARRAESEGLEVLTGHQKALLGPPDDMFFSCDEATRTWVQSSWANVMTTYLAFRKLTRPPAHLDIDRNILFERVDTNAELVTAFYEFDRFETLENDLEPLVGRRLDISRNRSNPGPLDAGRSRWDALLACFESDANRRRMDRFVEEDDFLMEHLNFR